MGGQPLASNPDLGWCRDWNPLSNNESYDKMISRANALFNILDNRGDTFTVDGFYWMQGEHDTLLNYFATIYTTNLRLLMSSVRSEVKFHPQAKTVFGKISLQYCIDNPYNIFIRPSGCGFPVFYPYIGTGQPIVRAALQTVADEDAAVEIVETSDLARTSADWVHLLPASQLTLGTRFANAATLPNRVDGSSDYDGDGVSNLNEDTNGNGNLGDDDSDGDVIPNYVDAPAVSPTPTPTPTPSPTPTPDPGDTGGGSDLVIVVNESQLQANLSAGTRLQETTSEPAPTPDIAEPTSTATPIDPPATIKHYANPRANSK